MYYNNLYVVLILIPVHCADSPGGYAWYCNDNMLCGSIICFMSLLLTVTLTFSSAIGSGTLFSQRSENDTEPGSFYGGINFIQ